MSRIEAFKLSIETAKGPRVFYCATYSAAYDFAVTNVLAIAGDFTISRNR